jgi:predicted DNA-binding transcriptional regulator AlpA
MPRLLRPAGVAEYLGISRSQLYMLGILLELRPVLLGKDKRYDIRDLDAWVERQKSNQQLRKGAKP